MSKVRKGKNNMRAWAILLGSKSWNRIYCLFASTKEEALGKAFAQLSEQLRIEKDKEKGVISDYTVVISTSADAPLGFTPKTSKTDFSNGSFEDQIRQVRKD